MLCAEQLTIYDLLRIRIKSDSMAWRVRCSSIGFTATDLRLGFYCLHTGRVRPTIFLTINVLGTEEYRCKIHLVLINTRYVYRVHEGVTAITAKHIQHETK